MSSAADAEHAGNVAQVLFGAAFLVVPQLGQDHVFRRRRERLHIRKNRLANAASQLAPPPGVVLGNHEVDLVAGCRMNHVELPSRQHRFSCRGAAHIEFRRGKRVAQAANRLDIQLQDNIDIVGQSRLAVGRTGVRTHDHVGQLLLLQNLDDESQQVILVQGSTSGQSLWRFVRGSIADVANEGATGASNAS